MFIPGYERNSPVASSDPDRLVSAYRLIWGYRLIGGKPPYSFQVMSAIPQSRQVIMTALYRDTALSRDNAL